MDNVIILTTVIIPVQLNAVLKYRHKMSTILSVIENYGRSSAQTGRKRFNSLWIWLMLHNNKSKNALKILRQHLVA